MRCVTVTAKLQRVWSLQSNSSALKKMNCSSKTTNMGENIYWCVLWEEDFKSWYHDSTSWHHLNEWEPSLTRALTIYLIIQSQPPYLNIWSIIFHCLPWLGSPLPGFNYLATQNGLFCAFWELQTKVDLSLDIFIRVDRRQVQPAVYPWSEHTYRCSLDC